MRLALYARGRKFRVMMVDLSERPGTEDCPAWVFLETLKRDKPKSHRTMVATIEYHSNDGPITNTKRSRVLRDQVIEFKSPDGDRLMYFYLPNFVTVLADGFHKGAQVATEVDRVLGWKAQIEEEITRGNIRI